MNVSVGMQGIGVGNPGYSVVLEKNRPFRNSSLNVYLGIGLRSNEAHGHLIGGVKIAFGGGFVLGLQDDGHERSPFAMISKDQWTLGVTLAGGKRMAYLFGVKF